VKKRLIELQNRLQQLQSRRQFENFLIQQPKASSIMSGSTTTVTTANRVLLVLGHTNLSEEISQFLNDDSTVVVSVKSLNDVLLQQQRNSISKASIESLVLVMHKSEVTKVYNNPMELANWVPLLRRDSSSSSIELHVIEDNKTSSSSLQPIHTSFLLAGLKATSEEQQPTKMILRAELRKKSSTQSQPIQIKKQSDLRMNLTDDDTTTDESSDDSTSSNKIDRLVLTLGSTETLEEVSLFAKDNKNTKVVSAKSLNDVLLQNQRKEATRDAMMFDSLVFFVKASEVAAVYNNPLELANWIPLLRSDSSIEFRIILEGTSTSPLQPIHTSFLLAGLKAKSEEHKSTQLVLHAERKKKTSTQSKPIQFKKKEEKSSSVLRINLDDDDDESTSSLLDEDDLLDDDAFMPNLEAPKRNTKDDAGGRKPCDNCSCGRAEVYADDQKKKRKKLTKKEVVQKSSACGNCPKGDAFRCASCPFLGKPAYKAGEEHLVLDLVDDF